MNKSLILSLLLTCSSLTACLPTDFIDVVDPYRPGATLADSNKGTVALANLSKEQLLQLVPTGMSKSEVTAKLGEPNNVSQSSNGVSVAGYYHNFTSYQARIIRSEYLTITYDAQDKVTKVDVNTTNDRF